MSIFNSENNQKDESKVGYSASPSPQLVFIGDDLSILCCINMDLDEWDFFEIHVKSLAFSDSIILTFILFKMDIGE